ncbi:MAG TPA: pectinesterase family protein [Opitutaceae bacterium]|jgi:pectinesterase
MNSFRDCFRRAIACATFLAVAVAGKAGESVVAADGTGQFKAIQEAINAAPPTASASDPWTIRVRPGTYTELVYVQREKHFVRLQGADPATTILTFDLRASMPGADGKPIGTFHTPTLWIDGDDFTVSGLTIANSAGRVGQALALRADGDRERFLNCRFLGWQDTILVNRGRQYFRDCRVEGAVDFIFGAAASYFDHCTIVCTGNGYITAASTPAANPFGLVFTDCKIQGSDAKVETYLGRPWREYASVAFLRCDLSGEIRPEGWSNWQRTDRFKHARYVEYDNTGPGAATVHRVPWSRQLSSAEAAAITPAAVLGGSDGWNPTK